MVFREELWQMRQGICEAYKIEPYMTYTEEQLAMFIGKDPSTPKRWRMAGKIFPVVEPGGKGIRYFGFQIADIIMGRPIPWDVTSKEISGSGNTTSPSETAPRPGIGAGEKVTPQGALASARRTLKTPSKS
ncbi:hypothetical protein [Bradyrhizobium sp.]|uniref:hypothetical protein n=1 Tax=Bradyrhizobium sp. TaxID=376 RepID=UPI0027336AF3|nr:hypothetical protein [Bradyrhizobium sp.]MDP3078705.1 hypothetical protein [Bradyrhizobium sp.]